MAKNDQPANALFADYVCPTHGTVETIEPLGDKVATVPSALRCAHDVSSAGVASICGQEAVFVVRTEEGRDTEAGDPNPHATGQAAEADREQA